MILKEYAVKVEPVDDGNVRLIWDGIDEVLPVTAIFSDQVLDEGIINSIRCFCLIENKPDPTTQSVIAGISARGGIHTPSRPIYVHKIEYVEDRDCYSVTYGYTPTDASYGIQFTRDALEQRPNSPVLLAYQIGAFLRFAGHTSLTPDAIAAIESRKFRGF